jgi:hypothetical protein
VIKEGARNEKPLEKKAYVAEMMTQKVLNSFNWCPAIWPICCLANQGLVHLH